MNRHSKAPPVAVELTNPHPVGTTCFVDYWDNVNSTDNKPLHLCLRNVNAIIMSPVYLVEHGPYRFDYVVDVIVHGKLIKLLFSNRPPNWQHLLPRVDV